MPLVRVVPYAVAIGVLWTVVVCVSLGWNIVHERWATLEGARTQARVGFAKDVDYRRWNAEVGGVYAPAAVTKPNEYLRTPRRDVTTTDGTKLTLINPAYMTRQVHEIAARTSGVLGHITSLKLIRPQNAPDPWEKRALESFTAGNKEASSIELIKGTAHMRLMRPLITEQGCLACHQEQGYKVGDVRGGISVSVPMEPFRAIARAQIQVLSVAHGMLWLLGMLGLVFGSRRLLRQVSARQQAEAGQQRLIGELKDALAHVKTLSGLLPICASCKKVRDDKGYWETIEVYISERSEAEFTHSICADCSKKLYPTLFGDDAPPKTTDER